MQKIVIHRPGGHDRLRMEQHPDLSPGPGEVLVAVEAIGVNYADCVTRMGLYASAKHYVGFPITPGKVRGDSMIEEGILDGDYVVIEQRDSANNGEIVVALVRNEEVTLKRIEQKPEEVVLHPANVSMEAMTYLPDEVQVQGLLKGLLRSYR